MQQQKCHNCELLVKQLTSYRQKSISEKEQMKRDIEKCKQQLEKFTSKIDKRVDARIKEEKNVTNNRIEQLEETHHQELSKLNTLLTQKDRVIDEMRNLLRLVESQKRELIQNNTKMLVELSQGIEVKGEKPSEVIDQNYKELLKMYQFLIDENNELKKEIYVLKKQNLLGNPKNDSILGKQEKSLNSSEYRPRELTDSSKRQIVITTKSPQVREKQKDKPKKVPTQKNSKRVV